MKQGNDKITSKVTLWGGKQKTLCVTLGYVKITISDINCILKNLKRDNSRSEKNIKRGIGLYSFIT